MRGLNGSGKKVKRSLWSKTCLRKLSNFPLHQLVVSVFLREKRSQKFIFQPEIVAFFFENLNFLKLAFSSCSKGVFLRTVRDALTFLGSVYWRPTTIVKPMLVVCFHTQCFCDVSYMEVLFLLLMSLSKLSPAFLRLPLENTNCRVDKTQTLQCIT